MFFRTKKSGKYRYLQLVENQRVDGKVRQTVLATVGRLDRLNESGAIDRFVRSAARFGENLMILSAAKENSGADPDAVVQSIGPALVFERLWRESGFQTVIGDLLETRRFRFDVERAVFLTVLHRIMTSGSDRSALKWRENYLIESAGELQLQHLYRAMAWLGEELDDDPPEARFPRRVKDRIEEKAFARRRDLFRGLDLVFFDTTSLFFTGEGGKSLGQYGKSKDRRNDCRQMVLGIVLDAAGIPIASEMWPGNTADVTTLDLVAGRLGKHFGIGEVCVVADAGMISKKQIAAIEARGWRYILGARPRATKEVAEVVLGDEAPFEEIEVERQRPKPMKLEVKEVVVGKERTGRRYIVCKNPEQAARDAAKRTEILEKLEGKLSSEGPKGLVANRGFRRYLKAEREAMGIDEDKIRSEEKFDGIWVLRTNAALTPADVALRYKQLWMVEQLFRHAKNLLETRPIFHRTDAAICGHVFCSFLALVLKRDLLGRMEKAGIKAEWDDVLRDLRALAETILTHEGRRFAVRSRPVGVAGKIVQCLRIRLPNVVRRLDDDLTTQPHKEPRIDAA